MLQTRSVVMRLAAVALFAVMVTGCLNKNQQTAFDLVNASRQAAGLDVLAESTEATAKAQAWADHLAESGDLAHSAITAGLEAVDWRTAAENVGWNSDGVAAVHHAYLDSPTHADNIFGDWTHLGVGVAEVGGRTYTVHVFLQM